MTSRLDEENILSKEIIIEVVERIRKVLFPGFFDNGKVRTEYIRFLIGEHLEFIQYNLKKQIAKALGNKENCDECPKFVLSKQSEVIANAFIEKLPKFVNISIQMFRQLLTEIRQRIVQMKLFFPIRVCLP